MGRVTSKSWETQGSPQWGQVAGLMCGPDCKYQAGLWFLSDRTSYSVFYVSPVFLILVGLCAFFKKNPLTLLLKMFRESKVSSMCFLCYLNPQISHYKIFHALLHVIKRSVCRLVKYINTYRIKDLPFFNC